MTLLVVLLKHLISDLIIVYKFNGKVEINIFKKNTCVTYGKKLSRKEFTQK